MKYKTTHNFVSKLFAYKQIIKPYLLLGHGNPMFGFCFLEMEKQSYFLLLCAFFWAQF